MSDHVATDVASDVDGPCVHSLLGHKACCDRFSFSSLKTPKSSHILFYDDMVFVIECASYFTYRDETSIFVIDVHLFYDEMAVVIEAYSFYDDLFLSLI